MINKIAFLIWTALLVCFSQSALSNDLTISTVTRSPFSMFENGEDTGFALDLFREVADDLGWSYTIQREDSFSDMLAAVTEGDVDAAIANISITASREAVLDFTQPIFAAGLQIMARNDSATAGAWSAIISTDVVLAVVLAFALLLLGGMLMWRLERDHQEYFDMPARSAMFPAFWWALNLILNGGFEERQPRSPLGRIFGVLLVISSLFFVSFFVARITTAMTVDAIQSNVSELSDLYGKKVATIEGSTTDEFLTRRDMKHVTYSSIDEMFQAFENVEIDAIVFDAPILAYYVKTQSESDAQLVGRVFLPENYGIALPSGSPLAESINQSLLKLREDGTYQRLYREWFGIQ